MTALREEKASRIILTRPAVEAGEALGFLPGDLYEKIEPYLRPLHDALHDTTIDGNTIHLPFDLKQVVENLRYELYSGEHTNGNGLKTQALTKAYYLIRPLLPVGVRDVDGAGREPVDVRRVVDDVQVSVLGLLNLPLILVRRLGVQDDDPGAASADHCTFLTDDDVDALTSTPVVATLLPGVEFSCRQPFPQARRLLDAGAVVALATDCNPGSSFTSSMPFCIALAVREMGMTTEEAVWAATAGGARALRRTDIGHLGVGARADLILLDAPSHTYLAYRPGVPQIAAVWQAGNLVAGAVP